MRTGSVIVALVVVAYTTVGAQTPPWHLDIGAATLVEAWDLNEAREELAGVMLGVDRQIWKGLAVRVEATVLGIAQQGQDGWLRGVTIGTRTRWQRSFGRPFVEIGLGASQATVPVSARGTTFNFVLLSGGGLELPFGGFSLDLGMRWFHVSNNGRQGARRNPDTQSLGPVIAIGWSY